MRSGRRKIGKYNKRKKIQDKRIKKRIRWKKIIKQ
jgi:hypothetical protein